MEKYAFMHCNLKIVQLGLKTKHWCLQYANVTNSEQQIQIC